MRFALIAALFLAAPLPHARAEDPLPDPAPSQDTAARFVALCAPCHGETGDGKGTAQLDRPARSFRDGGFSYGNTLPALYRSITTGIPGTPMPGFESALDEAERRALAEYVLALGPKDAIKESSDRVLTIGERPQVVRGLLPPIVDGGVERPRGMLLGTTAGTSFEYRVDDVRLLGVRQGDFVERRDWTERGGAALRPLGKLVHLHGGGDPPASFVLVVPRDPADPFGVPSGEQIDLAAELAGTWVRGDRVGLSMRVRGAAGELCALVEEEVATVVTSVGSGWVRRFRYTGGAARARVVHRFADEERPESREAVLATETGTADAPGPKVQWLVVRRPEGGFEARGVLASAAPSPIKTVSASAVWIDIAPGRSAEVEVTTLLLPAWSAPIEARLRVEVTR